MILLFCLPLDDDARALVPEDSTLRALVEASFDSGSCSLLSSSSAISQAVRVAMF